ncbi:hypothetical protein [Natronomonas sp. EA1]|uniref:hypothetical protein n=1 Tax=Natronomonas sp. EA1 TaxID=3421655 RepID=UPI003EC046B6
MSKRSGVFDDLQREMSETGERLRTLFAEFRSGDRSKEELKAALEREATETGRNVTSVLEQGKRELDHDDRSVLETLKSEFRNR